LWSFNTVNKLFGIYIQSLSLGFDMGQLGMEIETKFAIWQQILIEN
jgi:hypothetical protein